MRGNLEITRRLVWSGFRQQSTYRLAALGGLVANATFGFLKVAILFATVEAAGGELNGYDVGTMSAYIWLSQGLLGSVNLHGRSELSERVKTGDVAVDFLRPLNVQLPHVATETGGSLFALIPRGVPSVPTRGSATTCGLRPVQDRVDLARRIGVVFGQRSQLWWDLPVAESFRILASIHRLTGEQGRARTDELVECLEMGEFLTTPVRQLSLGQRMRAEVAAALLHSPDLVILDEPTIGLDVLSKQRLREFLVDERRRHGTTLLLTTHDMGDIERLCDRVLVVDHGRLAFDGTLKGLSRTVGAHRVLVVDLAEPTEDLVDIPGTNHLGSEARGLQQRFAFDAEQITAAQALAAVSTRAEVRDLSIEEPDIEDVVRRVYAVSR